MSKTNFASFDIFGQPLTHQQITDGTTYDTSYVYNIAGAMIEETYPSGRVVKNTFDENGDLSAVASKKNSSQGYWNYADSFAYNTAGAITKMQLGDGKWETSSYNNRQQISQIGLGTTDSTTDLLKLEYKYDTTTTSHDNNGSMRERKIIVPTVGSYSGFTAIQSYGYDASGKLVAEYATNVASVEDAQVAYMTQDHLGSPRVTTNRDGIVTTRKDFAAFGEEVVSAQRVSGSSGNGYDPLNIRQYYTGYEKDAESGLEFAQARYYNPTHGRFTSVDPLTASASIRDPQTFNRYSYVLNSPYKFTDPLGLLSVNTVACGQFCPNSGLMADGSSGYTDVSGNFSQEDYPKKKKRPKPKKQAPAGTQKPPQPVASNSAGSATPAQDDKPPTKGWFLDYVEVGIIDDPQNGEAPVKRFDFKVYLDGELTESSDVTIGESVPHEKAVIEVVNTDGTKITKVVDVDVPGIYNLPHVYNPDSITPKNNGRVAGDAQGMQGIKGIKAAKFREVNFQDTDSVTFTLYHKGKVVGSRTITTTASMTNVVVDKGKFIPKK